MNRGNVKIHVMSSSVFEANLLYWHIILLSSHENFKPWLKLGCQKSPSGFLPRSSYSFWRNVKIVSNTSLQPSSAELLRNVSLS